MRINLDVPWCDKDEVKRAGARWDLARKVWFIEDVEDLAPFMPWIDSHLKKKHSLTPADEKALQKKKPTSKEVKRHIRRNKQKKNAKQAKADSPINAR